MLRLHLSWLRPQLKCGTVRPREDALPLEADVQIVGVDCASQPKNVGVAFASGRRVVRTYGRSNDPLAQVLDWIDPAKPLIVALDAPLGWPAPMTRAFGTHVAGEHFTTRPNDFFRRTTDKFIKAKIGKQPLDVGADRIARTAHAALSMLKWIRSRTNRRLPLLWDASDAAASGVIEVYPAATLKSHRLPFGGYKSGSQARAVRDQIEQQLSELIMLPADRTELRACDDALDAAICVLAALDFLDGTALPPADLELARTEGWIWVRDPNLSAGAA